MPAIVLTLLQGLLLLLLYVFIGRAVRAVIRDVRAPVAAAPARPRPAPARAQPNRPRGDRRRPPPGQLVVHIPGGRPRVLDLDGAPITFGRGQGVTVQLSDPFTSDQHAKIHRHGGDWVVSDLGSTNGTFVNQVKVAGPTPIAAGDQLGIGRTVVEVRR